MAHRWILTPESDAKVGHRVAGYEILKVSKVPTKVDAACKCRLIQGRTIRQGVYLYSMISIPTNRLR